MIEEQALITKVRPGRVSIQSLQSSACQHCVQAQACSTTLFKKILPQREMEIASALSLTEGDKVIVGIEENHLLKASLLVYMLPLLCMLLLVGFYQGSELSTAFLALCSLTAGLLLVKKLQHGFILRFITPPRIIRKI